MSIPRKKKLCKGCGEMCFIFSKGLCLSCDKITNSSKYQINTKVSLGGLKSYKKINPISDRRKKELLIYNGVRDLYLKMNPVCEFPKCNSREVQLHHRAGRSGRMLYEYSYFCSLCHAHHMWVHENDKEARAMGLLLQRT